MSISFLSLVHLAILDTLMQRGFFELFQKLQAISWCQNYYILKFLFISENEGQGRKKLNKFEYPKNQKKVLGEIISIFLIF